jgi:hypothetical protein
LLPRTLASLREAGFDKPRLFVDGANPRMAERYESEFRLEVTARHPVIRVYGNWVLSLAELYIREPNMNRYAVFQDDFVTYRNLRGYLEKCPYPEKGYWNLYTMPSNQIVCPKTAGGQEQKVGWYPSNQNGRGAVALIFSLEAVLTLLTNQTPVANLPGSAVKHMVDRPMDCHRGWRSVDGGVSEAMTKAGWKEHVHNPSLVQHTGMVSAMRNKPHKLATSFRGEEFDAATLVALSGEK